MPGGQVRFGSYRYRVVYGSTVCMCMYAGKAGFGGRK